MQQRQNLQGIYDTFTLDSVKIYDVTKSNDKKDNIPPIIDWEQYEPLKYNNNDIDNDNYTLISKRSERIYGKYDSYYQSVSNNVIDDNVIDDNIIDSEIDEFPEVFIDDNDIDDKDDKDKSNGTITQMSYTSSYTTHENTHNMYVSQTKTGGPYFTTS